MQILQTSQIYASESLSLSEEKMKKFSEKSQRKNPFSKGFVSARARREEKINSFSLRVLRLPRRKLLCVDGFLRGENNLCDSVSL
jgi:hypothetical protein